MSRLVRNIRYSVFEYAASAVSLLVNLAVIRHLGTDEYGIYNYYLSIIAIIASVAGLGCFDQAFMREMAQGKSPAAMVWGMFWLRAVGTVFIFIGTLIFQFAVGQHEHISMGLLLLAWTFSLGFIRDTFRQSFIASQEMGSAVILSLVAYMLGWILRLLAIALDGDVTVFLTINFIEILVGGGAYYFAYRRRHPEMLPCCNSLHLGAAIAKQFWPLLVTALSVAIFMRIDQILLFHLTGAHDAGLYSSLIWVMERMFFLSAIIMGSFFPYLSQMKVQDPAWFDKSIRIGYKVMAIFSIPIAIATTMFSTTIVEVLLGKGFSGGVPALMVLIWTLPFIFCGALNQRNLVIHHRLKTDMIFAGLSAILNVLLNILLIPRLGLVGAAVASVAGHAFYILLQLFIPALRMYSVYIFKSLVGPLIAGSVAGLVTHICNLDGVAGMAMFSALYTLQITIGVFLPLSEDYATIGRQIKRFGIVVDQK